MRRFNLFALALIALLNCFIACSDDDPENVIPPSPQEQNKYITGTDLSRSYNLEKSLPVFLDEPYRALGYGYDITGKYAHPDWIRKKVVNIQYLKDSHSDVIGRASHSFLGGNPSITGTKSDIKKELLKKMKIDGTNALIEYKNAFKGSLDMAFENDTTFVDTEYYYVMGTYTGTRYKYFIKLYGGLNVSFLHDYLTDDFKLDMKSKSAEEIIALYGTHVMMDITVGWRQDYYFRSTSNETLEGRMNYTSLKLLGSTNGSTASSYYPKESVEKENLYSEYVSGAAVLNEPVASMFDITNYSQNLRFHPINHNTMEDIAVLIDLGGTLDTRPIIPIYEFVSDVAKKEALQKAYKEYLEQ